MGSTYAERHGICKFSDEQLAREYRTFPLAWLLHDWRCNITEGSREILRREFERRGIDPPLRRSDSHTGGV